MIIGTVYITGISMSGIIRTVFCAEFDWVISDSLDEVFCHRTSVTWPMMPTSQLSLADEA